MTLPISDNIKKLRELHNLSQKELAEIAGVTDKAVSTWESGLKEPRMGAIQKMADHFGLMKSNIIEDDGLKFSFTAQPLPTISEKQQKLNDCFIILNSAGQDKAVEYVNDLAENPKYQLTNNTAPLVTSSDKQQNDDPYIPRVAAAHHPTGKLSDADKEDIKFLNELVGKLKKENGE